METQQTPPTQEFKKNKAARVIFYIIIATLTLRCIFLIPDLMGGNKEFLNIGYEDYIETKPKDKRLTISGASADLSQLAYLTNTVLGAEVGSPTDIFVPLVSHADSNSWDAEVKIVLHASEGSLYYKAENLIGMDENEQLSMFLENPQSMMIEGPFTGYKKSSFRFSSDIKSSFENLAPDYIMLDLDEPETEDEPLMFFVMLGLAIAATIYLITAKKI